MKINTIKLIPKNWKITNKGNKIKLYYHNKRPQNNPKKSFKFKKIIKLDKEFYEGLGLFLGDADLNRKEKRHLSFCSIDKDIALHALNFLKKYFNVNIKDITFTVNYNKTNNNLKEEWASYLKMPKNKILTRHSIRNNHEAIQIQVNGVIFRKIFELIIKEALSKDFLKMRKLRIALLRGLFAAEGSIGIDYLEKKPYISQITFNLHINENKIANYITNTLKKERINFRISPRPKNNSLEIIISNWENYWKLWQIKAFELCKRKKKQFLNTMKRLKIHTLLNNQTRNLLFDSINLKQKEIAKLIGSYQGNVCKIQQGKINLTIEQLEIMRKQANLPKSKLKNSIKTLRVGNLTHITDLKFKEYMFRIKT